VLTLLIFRTYAVTTWTFSFRTLP